MTDELKAAYCKHRSISPDAFNQQYPNFAADFSSFCAGHAAAQPKWVSIKSGIYPHTSEDVWCLLSNGHIVRGGYFSPEFGWEWDNENDDDADASVTHWMPITPPAPPEQS